VKASLICEVPIIPHTRARGEANLFGQIRTLEVRLFARIVQANLSPILPSRNTECPGGAYDRYDGTALHPGFAGQRFRHILSTARSVPFRRAEAFRIRRLSLMTELVPKA
jgi:hypothetical protein